MKKLSFLFAALVAGVSFVSSGATTSVPKPEGLTDLTDDTASRVTSTTSTSQEAWLVGPGTAFHNKGVDNKNTSYRVIRRKPKACNIIYTFDAATTVNAYAFCMFNNGMDTRAPKTWKFYGSNSYDPSTKTETDGMWTLIDERDDETSWGNSEYRYFQAQNETAYKSYKMDILDNNEEEYIQFNFMEFFYYSVFFPILGDCALTKVEDGKFSLSGVLTKNDATAVKIVLSTSGQEDVVKTLGTATEGVPFEFDVTAEGLRTDVFYTATVIAENASGVSTPKALPESYFFGVTPKVMNFKKKIDFVLSDEAQAALGASDVADVPVAIRVSTDIQGFDYADMNASGTDVIFGAVDGSTITRYPYELEKWDPNGESVFWVKVPSLSAATTISMCYGNNVFVPDNVPTDVWSDYIGVWHMTGGSGVETDATGHGLAGTPTGSKLTEMTSDANAVVGVGRVNQTTAGKYNRLSVPSYNNFINDHSRFTVSGWFKSTNETGYPRPMSRKNNYNETTGWEIQYNSNSKTQCEMRGSSDKQVTMDGPDVTADWVHLSYVFNGTTGTAYANGGASKKSGTIVAVKTRTEAMAIGNNSNGSEQGWCGSYDEVRMYNGVQSDARVKSEYLAMTPGFLVAGDAEPIDETAVRFAGKPSLSKVGDAFKVSVTAASDSGTGVLKAVYDAANEDEKSIVVSDVVEPDATYAATLTEVTEDKSYRAGFFAVNDKETETRAYATDVLYNGTLTITKGADADEKDLATPGTIIVSRGDAYGPLIVNYTVGGTAVGGTHYRELPGSIVIPDGATSATIEIWPIRTKTDDHAVTITLAEGLYFIDDGAKSATIAVKKLVAPDGWNTWLASESGKASDAANWSDGVPKTGDKILFDARYSTADCEWDGGVNGLATSVAEWTQAEGFTGTVTIDTAYDGSFKTLAISGDAVVNGGKWTQKANSSVQVYRLKVSVGGDFTLGAGASVNLQGKGYSGGSLPTGVHAAPVSVSSAGWSEVRGDVREPSEIGACGASGYPGGGAFWLEVTGSAVVDGSITVRGADNSGVQSKASAAPGSIYIKAKSLGGAGSMNASAIACNQANSKGASGGRVSIVLTGAVAMDFDEANITAKGCNCSTAGGAGTILIKTTTTPNFGRLIIDTVANGQTYVVRYQSRYAATCVPPGETWELDEIHFRGSGVLSIPPNATLELKGPLTKITGDTSTAGNHGIIYMGGTFTFTHATPDVITGGWRFMPDSPFTFDGDLTIGANGSVGCFNLRDNYTFGADGAVFQKCDLTVTGDLILSGGGSINATGGSGNLFSSIFSSGGAMRGASHGGLAKDAKSLDFVYDSVFNPRWPGMCADSSGDTAYETTGGGAVKLTVGGCLTLDSKATIAASGVHYQNKSGAGGSIDIRCGQINMDPAASISVNSPSSYSWSGDNTGYPGGAGRIALRIATANPALPAHKITANGYTSINGVDKAGNTQHASAGTVYIENGSEMSGKGEVKVGNDNKTYNVLYTPIPSRKWGGENDDWRGVSLIVTNCGQVVLTSNLRLRELSMSAAGRDKLDLNGNTMTVDRAFMKSLKLPPGTYTTNDTEVADILLGDGSLIVKGTGMVLIVR